jgi:dienelactone hydrolase
MSFTAIPFLRSTASHAIARHPRVWQLLALTCLLALLAGCVTSSLPPTAGPWDMRSLATAPAVTWGETNGLVQEIYYEGEPLNGKPTRVFAYLGRPAEPAHKKLPAMVLVHGGGGKAFKAWAEHWAKRGYLAIAMDLAGNGPNGRLPDGGPDQSDKVKFRDFTTSDAREMWTYHAVAAVVRAHSLLRSLPEVDSDRVGLTGISWGGYLTCIVAGIDARFQVAVPVYGCGFLGDNSYWISNSLARMTPEARALWLKLFDPSAYLGQVRRPILFVNGTTDFAYPLDSYQKSYRLVPEKFRHVSVAVNRPHGHIWTFPEVDAFVDSVLRREPALARIATPSVSGATMTTTVDQDVAFQNVSLCYTTNSGPWQKREWRTVPAFVSGHRIGASLPEARPLVAFFALKDEQGRHVSSEHVELPAP